MPYPERNPYVGPRTFEESDSAFFFGRDREARDLLSLVIAEPLTLFYAQSGAGKSSLLNTRLIPGLREEGFVVLPVTRVGGALPVGFDDVPNIFVFNFLLGLDSRTAGLFNPHELAQMSIADYLAAWRADHEEKLFAADPDADEPAVALIVDQFEEILTTNLARWHERRIFFEQLAEAMKQDSLLWVVLTLREDFVAGLEPFARLFPGRMRARFYMKRMGAQAARKAIEQPATQAGRPFAAGVARRLVDNLRQLRTTSTAEEREEQTATSVKGEFVEPVQLQVVCFQLWDNLPPDSNHTEITQEDVDSLGDVDEALGAFYEEAITAVVNETGHSELELRSWFERQLITEAQTRGTVYQGRYNTAGMPNDVISKLADRFLLRAEIRAGGTWYELVHDRFIDPIMQANASWRAAQSPLIRAAEDWFENDRSRDRLYQGQQLRTALAATQGHKLEPIVREFLEESQAEEARQIRSRRRLVLTAAVLTALAILAIVSSVVAFQRQLEAEANAQLAQENAVLAQTREAEAAVSADLAATREAEARANLTLAEQRAAEARENLQMAQTNAEEAQANADLAATRAAEAEIAREQAEIESQNSLAQSLVAVAPYVIDRTNDTERAVLLSLEAAKVQEADRDIRRLIDNLLRDILSRPYFNSILEAHQSFVHQGVFHPTRPWLASVDTDGNLLFWDLSMQAADAEPLIPDGDEDVFYWQVAFDHAPDRDRLAALGTFTDGEEEGADLTAFIDIWNLQNRTAGPLRLFLPPGYEELDLSDDALKSSVTEATVVWLALNGDQLIYLTPDQAVYRYDLSQPTSQPQRLFQDDSLFVTLSPSGRYLATADRFGLVRLRDLNVPGGTTAWFGVSSQGDPVTAMAFDVNEQLLATADANNVVRLWDATNDEPAPVRFPAADLPIQALAVSSDGRYVSSISSELSDLTVHVWDAAFPNRLPDQLVGHNSGPNSLTFSGDGSLLASTSDDQTIRLWNFAESSAAPTMLDVGFLPGLIRYSADGELLTAVDQELNVYLWAANELSAPPTQLAVPLTWAEDAPSYNAGYGVPRVPVAIGPSARTLATAEGDVVIIWRINPLQTTIEEEMRLPGQNVPVTALAFDDEGTHLAVATDDGETRIYHLAESGTETEEVAVSEWAVLEGGWGAERLAFSPDGQWLAGSMPQGEAYAVRVWDLTGETDTAVTLFGPEEFISDLKFSPTSDQLAASSYDTNVYLWEMSGDTFEPEPTVLEGHEDLVFAVAFAADDDILASSSWDTSIRLWDLTQLENLTAPSLLSGHSGQVLSLDYNPQDDVLASASEDGTVRLWSTQIESFVEVACQMVRRNLSWDEWIQYQGDEVPYRKTCDNLPLHPSVIDVGRDLAEDNEIDAAVAWFESLFELDPTLDIDPEQEARQYAARGLLSEGEQLAGQNDPHGALEAFEEAQALTTAVTVSAEQWMLLCNAGAPGNPAVGEGCRQATQAVVEAGKGALALELCQLRRFPQLTTAVDPACDFVLATVRTPDSYQPTLLTAVCTLPPPLLATITLAPLCNAPEAFGAETAIETAENDTTYLRDFNTTSPAYWEFNGTEGQEVLVTINSRAERQAEGFVAGYVLYASDGSLLQPNNVDVANGTRIYVLPQADTYRLELFGTGTYTINVTALE